MVTSLQTVAYLWLEVASTRRAVQGAGACEPDLFNTFFEPAKARDLVKAGCGKTARPVWAADGGEPFGRRLLRPDSDETG